MEILAKNTRLKYLNLSHITLFETKVTSKVKGGKLVEVEDDIEEYARFSIDCLIQFIKRNYALLHVDLSYTGLTEKCLMHFGTCLRRAKGLRSLHLSGNKITDAVVDHLVERAHCKRAPKARTIPWSKLPSNVWYKERSLQKLEVSK